jgi:hypothetical protein
MARIPAGLLLLALFAAFLLADEALPGKYW